MALSLTRPPIAVSISYVFILTFVGMCVSQSWRNRDMGLNSTGNQTVLSNIFCGPHTLPISWQVALSCQGDWISELLKTDPCRALRSVQPEEQREGTGRSRSELQPDSLSFACVLEVHSMYSLRCWAKGWLSVYGSDSHRHAALPWF